MLPLFLRLFLPQRMVRATDTPVGQSHTATGDEHRSIKPDPCDDPGACKKKRARRTKNAFRHAAVRGEFLTVSEHCRRSSNVENGVSFAEPEAFLAVILLQALGG